MRLSGSASLVVPAPPAEVFARILLDPGFLARGVPASLVLPGVAAARFEPAGGEVVPGTIRVVELTSGHTLREQITAFDPPHQFTYLQLDGFGFPFSLVCTGAEGRYDL